MFNFSTVAGDTPLYLSASYCRADAARYLLDHGADPDKADEAGLTPLHAAAGIGPLYSYVISILHVCTTVFEFLFLIYFVAVLCSYYSLFDQTSRATYVFFPLG